MRFFLAILFVFSSVCVVAQPQDSTVVLISAISNQKNIKPIAPKRFERKMLAFSEIKNQIVKFQKDGYLEAAADELQENRDTVFVKYHIGNVYKFGKINLDSLPRAVLIGAGIVEKDYNNTILSPHKIAVLTQKILSYAENNGYPFATVYFDNAKMDSSRTFYADLMYRPANLIRIDTINIYGTANVERSFIQSYLGIKKGDFYNESQIRSISQHIKSLVFLEEQRPWTVDFTIGGTKLNLYLQEKKSNQINALIGLQPNNSETKRFLWTADIMLLLNNALGYGESFNISYKNLQRNTPEVNLGAALPYVLGTKFGVDFKFNFFRRDTLYRRTAYEIGLRYQFNAKDFVRVYYQMNNNRVQQADTAFVKANKILSKNVDMVANGAGMEFIMNRTNYLYNPTKGWAAKLTLSVINRKIIKNDAVLQIKDGSGFDYNSLYDAANKQPLQYRVQGFLDYYFPLGKAITLKTAYNGAYISGQQLFQNELYQIGGYKILRGFDENSIYVNQYHLGTLEFRALFARRSYFYIFGEGGTIFSRYNLINDQNYPISFGSGITLDSKSGVFNVMLALGKTEKETFQFRNMRVHFGYVTYF